MKRKDETGNRYGRLRVVSSSGEKDAQNNLLWDCVCDCGNQVNQVSGTRLRRGGVKSCGCLRAETIRGMATVHGMESHPANRSYKAAKRRCLNVNMKSYPRYGGRGIEFRLPPFPDFWVVMGDSWFDGATIDRKDNDGHYELGNVRWATYKQQMQNTCRSVYITWDGVTKHQSEWAKELGFTGGNFAQRVRKHGVEWAFTGPRWKKAY